MKEDIKKLLKEKGVLPKKRLGQNFLVSKSVLEKITTASHLEPQDVVLEIGPGTGILTKELAKRVKKVIAVEKDKRLIEVLEEILNKDILKLQVSSFPKGPRRIVGAYGAGRFQESYKVVANLPYNIATEVIRKFLETDNPPQLMVVMVQKEVGQRICSGPPKMERLGVLVQALAEVKILQTVKKNSFWPQPKVDSVIIKIVPGQLNVSASPRFYEKFTKIVKIGFSHPRKQLINNFCKGLNLSREQVEKWLLKNNIQPTQRAETLTLDDWLNLTKTFNLLT